MTRLLVAFLLAATLSFIGCESTDPSPTVESTNEALQSADASPDVTPPGASSEDVEDGYPRLTWKRTHAPSGTNVTGTFAVSSFDVIKDRMDELDWSNEASDQPSIIVELDSINSLTIETNASEGDNELHMVAIWRRAGETQGTTTPILVNRSRPLKDVQHALALLWAHFNGDDTLESLTEWMTP